MKADPAALFPRLQIEVASTRWLRGRPLVLRIYLVVGVAFAGCLWVAGYPSWRIHFLVGLVAVFAGLLAWLSSSDSARPHASLLPSCLVLLLIGALVTGGLKSPFMVTPVFVLILGATAGWTRHVKLGLLLTALVMLAAPLLGPLVGPPVPEPYATGFTLVLIVVSLLAVMDHVAALDKHVVASTRELLRAREQMARDALSRTRELELLSSRLSHELKNPLGAIKALVQLSARSTSLDEVRERLAVVEGEVRRMGDIVQGYLTFAKPLEAIQVESRRLGELVGDVFEVLEARAAQARVTLVREGEAEAPVDPRRIKEALINLLDNAIEASPPGATVRVVLSQREGAAVVAVRDEGRGMPAHVLARLGTPFFTTREDGNGLGVLLARRAFEAHQGTLEYESEPGRGTVATGTVPRRAGGEGDAPRAPGR